MDRSERDMPRRGTAGGRDQRALANTGKPGAAQTRMAPRSGAMFGVGCWKFVFLFVRSSVQRWKFAFFTVNGSLFAFHPAHPSHLASVMNIPETARIMANRLRTTIHAERVWLFGSQARGNAGIDSDFDLLAVVPVSTVSRYQRAVAARRELAGFNIPVDIVVMTHDEWEKEIKAPCSLASTVTREGISI